MTAVRYSVLAFLSYLGFSATATSSSSTAPTTAQYTPLPTQLQSSSPTTLNTSSVECAVNYYTCNSPYNRHTCQCDERLCTQFRDCCAETQYTHNTTGPEFACVSTTFRRTTHIPAGNTDAYWMIATCPNSEWARIFVYLNYLLMHVLWQSIICLSIYLRRYLTTIHLSMFLSLQRFQTHVKHSLSPVHQWVTAGQGWSTETGTVLSVMVCLKKSR